MLTMALSLMLAGIAKSKLQKLDLDSMISDGGSGLLDAPPVETGLNDIEWEEEDLSHLTAREKKRKWIRETRKENQPPRMESDIKWEEFQEYHDAGNYTEKYHVFSLSKKYFFDRARNIT